jgi:5-methylcytosine-specific restriction endonuclease McrA
MIHVLQLNADYAPMKVLRWQRAVELVLDGKAVTVAPYDGRFVRSPSLAVPWPAVIALKRYARARGRVRFNSRNVQARDGYTCLYCGMSPRTFEGRPDRDVLTLDHVIPRAQAKHNAVYLPWSRRWVNVTCWENAATACRPCNMRKADRTPVQAGMLLRQYPRVPTQSDALRMMLSRFHVVPSEWEPWLPTNWRGPTAEPVVLTDADYVAGRSSPSS